MAYQRRKRKESHKQVSRGKVYIKSTFNNTIVTICDEEGNVLSWASSGMLGFKGAKKATPYASQMAAKSALEKAKSFGLSSVKIFVSGVGSGRESAVRGMNDPTIRVESIKDITPIPHNGPRPKKVRRV